MKIIKNKIDGKPWNDNSWNYSMKICQYFLILSRHLFTFLSPSYNQLNILWKAQEDSLLPSQPPKNNYLPPVRLRTTQSPTLKKFIVLYLSKWHLQQVDQQLWILTEVETPNQKSSKTQKFLLLYTRVSSVSSNPQQQDNQWVPGIDLNKSRNKKCLD